MKCLQRQLSNTYSLNLCSCLYLMIFSLHGKTKTTKTNINKKPENRIHAGPEPGAMLLSSVIDSCLWVSDPGGGGYVSYADLARAPWVPSQLWLKATWQSCFGLTGWNPSASQAELMVVPTWSLHWRCLPGASVDREMVLKTPERINLKNTFLLSILHCPSLPELKPDIQNLPN